MQKKFITAELLKEKVTGGDQAEFTLCKLMEYHNSDQGQLLEPGTMKNYYTTQKYIKEFIKERFKTSDKYLSELSYKFITDFEYYLRNRTPEKGQKTLNNNGLMKHIERFCKMINLAVRLEWIDRNPFHSGGQCIFYWRPMDILLVFTGGNYNRHIEKDAGEAFGYIVPAVKLVWKQLSSRVIHCSRQPSLKNRPCQPHLQSSIQHNPLPFLSSRPKRG